MIDEYADACPICLTMQQPSQQTGGDSERIDCSRCGEYRIAESAKVSLPQQLASDGKAQAVLSHAIRRMQKASPTPPLITNELANQLLQSGSLPSPAQQAENLILWLGDNLLAPGETVELDSRPLTAIIGALNESGVGFIRDELTAQGVLELDETKRRGTLTFKGWQRYEALQRGQSQSRKGFMAMAFKNETLNEIFINYFKPAAKAAGFDLIRVDENPPAGLIDAHLQNEIRTSRFLVADLTDRNPGAYWEAGFAAGLGKPVIYTCKKQVFETKRTHFDTNRFHTIRWEKEKPAEAGSKLKETIRATLPAEAKLTDD